jgi:hypothetical protein
MEAGARSAAGEAGQATVEWVALVLLVALAVSGLAAFRPSSADRGLGEALANRMSSAAAGPASPAIARAGGPASQGVARAAPAAATAPSGPVGKAARIRRAQAVNAFRRLRRAGALAKRLWIVCLGWQRFSYEREHPLAPTEAMPLAGALEIANTCLNPVSFMTHG